MEKMSGAFYTLAEFSRRAVPVLHIMQRVLTAYAFRNCVCEMRGISKNEIPICPRLGVCCVYARAA